jgi:hypothetical protein
VRRQAERLGLPPDLAQAVMMAESEGDATRMGPSGEVGLMQVRLATAMMLGFRGHQAELLDPALNVGYGVAHLAQAWRIAGGDPCRTYAKYRTHYGEERVERFADACGRLQRALAAMNSPLVAPVPIQQAAAPEPKAAEAPAPKPVEPAPVAAAPVPAQAQAVAHPLPPVRPIRLAAAPKPRPAAKAKRVVRRAERPAPEAEGRAGAEPEATGGVTLVARTRGSSRSALTCSDKGCKIEKADPK